MPREKAALVPGTLEMLILKTLSLGPLHGYGIAQHIQRLSRDVLRVDEGSLYPALQRLKAEGWVTADWKLTPTKRRARYYRLTAAGRSAAWRRDDRVRADDPSDQAGDARGRVVTLHLTAFGTTLGERARRSQPGASRVAPYGLTRRIAE